MKTKFKRVAGVLVLITMVAGTFVRTAPVLASTPGEGQWTQ